MKIIKVIGVLLLAVVVVAAAALGIVYVKTSRDFAKTYQVPDDAIAIPADEASLARGNHLANSLAGCTACHGEDLGGKVEADIPMLMRISTPNITTGKGGVVAGYTDADWIRTIRHGVARDGRGLLFMPANAYNNLSAADLGSVIAAVKRFKPVDRTNEPPSVGPMGRVLNFAGVFPVIAAETIDHTKPAPAAVSFATDVEHGTYLVNSGGCVDCHRDDLAGGRIKGTPPEIPPATNLTAAGPLVKYQPTEFVTLFRTGKRPDGSQLHDMMPWKAFGKMTDEELTAVFAYLRSLPERPTHVD